MGGRALTAPPDIRPLDPDDVITDLEELLAELRIYAYHDLDEAIRRATNGVWSIGCDNVVASIQQISRALGRPARWGSVPYPLLPHIYRAVERGAGVEPEDIDIAVLEANRARW